MIEHVRDHVIPAALSLLPARMDSIEARALLLAIGLQESGFDARLQRGGPAHGFFQFEQIGVQGVLEHRASAEPASALCMGLLFPVASHFVYDAIAYNDTLACGFARLLLWQHPDRLPRRTERDEAYDYYIHRWRPGRPRPEHWAANFERAWEVVEAGE